MYKKKWTVIPLLSNTLLSLVLSACLAACVSGCVTVNVNIPEGAVQQASDDYVRELYEAKEKGKNPTSDASPAAAAKPATPATGAADSRTVKTDSPKTLEIKARMKARRAGIKTLKEESMVGETKDGQLLLKGNPAADQSDMIKKTIADENKDRTSLYKEILVQNGMSKAHLPTIEGEFAHTFQKYSPSNTWIQDDDGTWVQKP